MSLLGILAGIAVLLTCLMFATRQAMLGFVCAMFWAIAGAQAYTLSSTPWGDIYFYLFFASTFGMTIFCSLAAFGLREKRDTLAEEEMDEEEDEDKGESGEDEDSWLSNEPKKKKRRERATKRRTRAGKRDAKAARKTYEELGLS